MQIVKLEANPNGAHSALYFEQDGTVYNGWAMIPEGFPVPDTFPFVEIQAEEVTYHREVECTRMVTKTREVESFDEEGNPVTCTEEYQVEETCTEQEPYTVMTVTGMTPGIVPEPAPAPDPKPTTEERVTALEDALAQTDEAAIELDEAQAAQEEINAAQDEALIELYEMIGG